MAVDRANHAFAQTLLPPGRTLPGADATTVAEYERMLLELSPIAKRGADALVQTLNLAAIARTGRALSRLPADERQRLARRWERDPVLRLPVLALSSLLKAAYFDSPSFYESLDCVYDKSGPIESNAWMRQVQCPEQWRDSAEVECDVVVIGTGAGGAAAGAELARRGLAVVFVEEGRYHGRDEFTGRSRRALRTFYRSSGAVVALGNGAIPILMGRMVGGSTALNGGTCARPLATILDRWCEEAGTDELSWSAMAPHFAQVEADLGVCPTPERYRGAVARVVARGCDALGWRYSAVRRNAPHCDGQGVCTFGCPTDAKRSTNVSYVPAALRRGAVLYTEARAHEILVRDGRAVGVKASSLAGDHCLRVRARAVVLSGGAIPTPMLLQRQGLANSSGQVGRNLTLHPTTMVSGLFEEPIRGYNAVPQGLSCDEFREDGMLIYSASAPPDSGAMNFAFSGSRLIEVMEAYERVATLTVIMIDESKGRVRRLASGRPLIGYWSSDSDRKRLHKGVCDAAELLLAGGARRLFPLSVREPEIADRRSLDAFRSKRHRAWDHVTTSVHPLGTCRMGSDPWKSVVGPDHETHDLRGLFIVDASALPSTPGVNPQLTIMAMAHRAAGKIADKLD